MKESIIIVTGLPRSGTSMMMRMLDVGGIDVVTDSIRKADEDNPKGYYEFELVKGIKNNTSWLPDCRNRAFKMVSQLLYDLPSCFHYQVIFMRRHMEEILASQRLMLERLGQPVIDEQKMTSLYSKHLSQVTSWIKEQDNIECLRVNFNDVVKKPIMEAKRVKLFLGKPMNLEAMRAVVEPSLYRNKLRNVSQIERKIV